VLAASLTVLTASPTVLAARRRCWRLR